MNGSLYKGTCWHCKNAARKKQDNKEFEVKCKLGTYTACQCAGTEDFFELDRRTIPRNKPEDSYSINL